MSSKTSKSTNVPIVSSPRWWIAELCLFCGLAIALLSWANRFSMNPNGISYLHMADQLLKGDLRALVHPY